MSPYDVLAQAEEKFLLACGWAKLGEDAWEEPEAIENPDQRVLTRSHAVNSETLHGPARGTCTSESRMVLKVARLEYLAATGWEDADDDPLDPVHGSNAWLEPAGRSHRKRRVIHGLRKAVNIQKQFDQGGHVADINTKGAQTGRLSSATPNSSSSPKPDRSLRNCHDCNAAPGGVAVVWVRDKWRRRAGA